MAIQGTEWIFVAVILLMLFLWGPEKIPKLAEALGRARREFEAASRGLLEELEKEESAAEEAGDEKLLEIARSLGIKTEGKTRDQLAREIIARAKKVEEAGEKGSAGNTSAGRDS